MKKLNKLSLLFLAIIANAQIITGKILAEDGRKPIPYARIGVENEPRGTISDEKGNFSFNMNGISRDKNVKAEVGGYENFIQKVGDFIKNNPNDILLKEKVRNIAEVAISPKKLISKNWGVTSKSAITFGTDAAGSNYKNSVEEVALFFRNSRRAKLERININIPKLEAEKPIFVRFVVYDKDLNPVAMEDLNGYITSEKLKNGTFSFDCSQYNIWLKGDFYVGMQLVNFSNGKFYMSGGLFGNRTIYRDNLQPWQKLPVVTPALNIDVKVEK